MATYNVDTSSFTPAQLAAFNNAAGQAAPGNTVVGQSAPATAAAANVKSPSAPQSSYIQSQANSGSLVNQLYAGQTQPQITQGGILSGATSGAYNPYSTTTTAPTQQATSQTVQGGILGQQAPTGAATTTMYKSDGTPVTVNSSDVALNTYNGNTNPNGYYASNPTTTNPNTTTTGSASTTPQINASAGNASTAGILGSMSPAQSQAYQQAQTINQELEQSRQNEANTVAGINTQPIPLEFQQGQAQVVQGQYQTQQDALAQQEAAQAGLVNTLSPSNTTQQVGQGTTVLGGNGQPIVTTPTIGTAGQAQYVPNPVQYNGATQTNTPATPNPTTGPAPSSYTVTAQDTGGLSQIAAAHGVTTAQLEAANPQISNFNLITPGEQINLPSSGGTSSGTGQGGTAGSPFTAGIVAGQAAAGAQNVQNKVAYAASQSLAKSVISDVQGNPGLNSSPTAIGNAIEQWVNTQGIPSGPYINFLNDLQEYANSIAPILGVGGNSSDLKTEIANQMVPILAQGGTIEQAIAHMDGVAAGKINSAPGAAQSTGPVTPLSIPQNSGTNSSTPTGAKATITTSVGGFYQDANGVWHAQ